MNYEDDPPPPVCAALLPAVTPHVDGTLVAGAWTGNNEDATPAAAEIEKLRVALSKYETARGNIEAALAENDRHLEAVLAEKDRQLAHVGVAVVNLTNWRQLREQPDSVRQRAVHLARDISSLRAAANQSDVLRAQYGELGVINKAEGKHACDETTNLACNIAKHMARESKNCQLAYVPDVVITSHSNGACALTTQVLTTSAFRQRSTASRNRVWTRVRQGPSISPQACHRQIAFSRK